MPDLDLSEADRCYYCAERGKDVILYGNGPCIECGLEADTPAMKWARAVADEDPDGFQGRS